MWCPVCQRSDKIKGIIAADKKALEEEMSDWDDGDEDIYEPDDSWDDQDEEERDDEDDLDDILRDRD